MRNLTKQMIEEALLKRLEKEPLSSITVVSLCEDCGINHNTFYYYYTDIFAVLQEYFEESLEKVQAEYETTMSWESAFRIAVRPAAEHKNAINHVYHSVQKDQLENYLFRVSMSVMDRFVDSIEPDVDAKPEDRRLIAKFFACALTEIVLHWIADGMSIEEADGMIARLGQLLNGSIEEALRRSAAGETFLPYTSGEDPSGKIK